MNTKTKKKISRTLKKHYTKKRITTERHKELKVITWILLAVALIGFYNTRGVIKPLEAQAPYTRLMYLPENTDKELSMMEWVKYETERAGLDWNEVYCLIQNESGWDDYAHHVNKDKTLDRGLVMWNSYWHPEVSSECAFDYKCAIKELIRVRKQDGNYHQWWGYVNNCS